MVGVVLLERVGAQPRAESLESVALAGAATPAAVARAGGRFAGERVLRVLRVRAVGHRVLVFVRGAVPGARTGGVSRAAAYLFPSRWPSTTPAMNPPSMATRMPHS
jgi:hypothetical protein